MQHARRAGCPDQLQCEGRDSTSIYGDRLLCDVCSKTVPNPPARTYEDTSEAGFEPFRWDV